MAIPMEGLINKFPKEKPPRFGVTSPKSSRTCVHQFLSCQTLDIKVSQYQFFSFLQRDLNPKYFIECPKVQAGLVKSLPSKELPANCHDRSTKFPGIIPSLSDSRRQGQLLNFRWMMYVCPEHRTTVLSMLL